MGIDLDCVLVEENCLVIEPSQEIDRGNQPSSSQDDCDDRLRLKIHILSIEDSDLLLFRLGQVCILAAVRMRGVGFEHGNPHTVPLL